MKKGLVVWIFVALLVIAIGALAYAFLNMKNAENETPNPPEPSWQTYRDAAAGYTLLYPKTFALDEMHVYQGLGPGKDIHGVSFTVPESLTSGTNLSRDSYFAVETLASTTDCTAGKFLLDSATEKEVTENGITYSTARSVEGAAGNFYEEQVYALPGSIPCIGMRYFIHSTNITNYDPGTVLEFDKGSLISAFDTMRQSLEVSEAAPEENP